MFFASNQKCFFTCFSLSVSLPDEGPFNASPDPPDPETLRRNIIEILDDNNEFPEKMRKLKAVVQPTSKSLLLSLRLGFAFLSPWILMLNSHQPACDAPLCHLALRPVLYSFQEFTSS